MCHSLIVKVSIIFNITERLDKSFFHIASIRSIKIFKFSRFDQITDTTISKSPWLKTIAVG